MKSLQYLQAKTKASIISIALFLAVLTTPVYATQDEQLTQKCLNSFTIIKNQDLDTFVSLMPYLPSAQEEKYAAKILQRSHKRWYLDREIDSIIPKGVKYSEPDDSKRQMEAVQQARVKLLITSRKSEASVSCKFVQTKDGWFLSKLP
jgi:hypothetical protein